MHPWTRMGGMVLCLLSLCSLSDAANRYVRAGATGANNGTDWTNAWTTWGAISTTGMVAGETIYIACGNYSGTGFGISVAGLRVQLATIASHGTSTGWSDTFDTGTCQAIHDRNDNSAANAQGNILANASNITIDGMRRYGIHVYGGYWAIGAFSGNFRADGLTVRNVEIGWNTTGADHLGEDCIQGRGNNLTLEDNFFHDCNDPNTHGDCIQWYSSNSMIVRRNRFHNCGQGMMFGLTSEIVQDLDFSSNIISADIDNPTLFWMSMFSGSCPTTGTFRLYQNTWYVNVPRTNEPWDTGSIASLAGCGAADVLFRNNALIRTRIDGISSTTHNNNGYDSSGSDAACTGFPTCNASSPAETGKVTAADLGFVSIGTGNTALNSDFHLQSSSVLRGAGATGLGIALDFEGKPFGSPPAIGAMEFAAVSAPPTATITAPTGSPTFTTANASLTTLAGTATDDIGVTSVTWTCDVCGSGTATCPTCGAAATSVSWTVPSITLQYGPNVITVTAQDGDNQIGTDVLTVTLYPAVTITTPTAVPTYTTGTGTLATLAGTAADDVAVTSVTWTNDRGGSGTAACPTCGTASASWSVSNIVLQLGVNVLTVTANDGSGNTATDTLTVTYALADITTGLLSRWALDGTTIDTGSNAQNGTLVGAPTYDSAGNCRVGSGCLVLNGSTQHMTVVQNGEYVLHAAPFTVALWVKDDTAASTLATLAHRLVSWNDGTTSLGVGLGTITGTTRMFYIQNQASDGIQLSTLTAVGTGWQHIAATYDGVSTYHLYINGVLDDSVTTSAIGVFTGNSTTLYVGQRGDGAAGTFVNGAMDDVRIYNRALTQSDITMLYQFTETPLASPTVLRVIR